MIEDYRRWNKEFTLHLSEAETWESCMRTIQSAFVNGCTCFRFCLKIKGFKFQDGFALRPEIHNEKAAIEASHEMWLKFKNTIFKVLDPIGYAKAMAEYEASISGPAQ